MTASAMARTYIVVTELVSHPEMLPLNEVALLNMDCSNTRCMSAGARAEWACEHMPAAPSSRAKPQHPHAFLGGMRGLKRRRESNMLGIRGVRRGIYI